MTDSTQTKQNEDIANAFTLSAAKAKELASAARMQKIQKQIHLAALEGKTSVDVNIDTYWVDREHVLNVIQSGGYKLLGGYKQTSKVTIDWS